MRINLFTRREISLPPPKEETPPTLIDDLLRQLNRIQAEKFRRIKRGERPYQKSMLLLDNEQSEILKRLYHDIGVLPVINHHTGVWYLFTGE